MVILIDTREQRPLKFAAAIETRVVTVPVGDYWTEYANGSRPPVFFERKSLADLYGTMTSGYERFKREMQLAASNRWKLQIVCEVTLTDVRSGFDRSQFSGDSMIKKLMTLWVRHGLATTFCDGRAEAADFIEAAYESIERNWEPAAASGKQTRERKAALFGAAQLPLVTEYD